MDRKICDQVAELELAGRKTVELFAELHDDFCTAFGDNIETQEDALALATQYAHYSTISDIVLDLVVDLLHRIRVLDEEINGHGTVSLVEND